jgi:hypothetical protein
MKGTTDVARGVAALQISQGVRFPHPTIAVSWPPLPTVAPFLWDLVTASPNGVACGPLTSTTTFRFSPDGFAPGRRLPKEESKLIDTATGQRFFRSSKHGLKLAFARDGERLLAVHSEGASCSKRLRSRNSSSIG